MRRHRIAVMNFTKYQKQFLLGVFKINGNHVIGLSKVDSERICYEHHVADKEIIAKFYC